MSGRQPLWPRASVFARSSSIARTTSRGNGRADARRVAHQEVLLEPRRVGGRDRTVVARAPNPVVTP